MDKQARKGKAKGQKGQDDTTDEITIKKGNEPPFLETSNEQADLSDKMDEAGAETRSESDDAVAGQEAQQ
jgi:hypothetical protein